MATIHVDGKSFEVDGADNLLEACLSLGLDIPYFCWHPSLGSVGACRQCAVKQYNDENDTRGRIVMSCMTPASDKTWISIDDEEAKRFRESVVEWLMTNHPHDCPVCEEGGHCHLQDMTVMTGHNKRRYRFTKRTHQNQDLGPFISHEMNRCIACYRCVRYYKDYAGGSDLGVYGAHDNVYFGRIEDGVLESEFSGNLVEVCPTGVFTDKTHSERYNRKWDMQFAPSICQQCSVGCNISPGERYGELRRIENRFNGAVNHYFLCDRGRFGYGYVNRADRPRQPSAGEQKLGIDAALDQAAALLKGRKVIGIGSPRASLESNYALRELVGAANFHTGIASAEQECLELMVRVLQDGALPTPSLRDIEGYDAIFVLGEDLTQTAPRIALALRQAVRGKATEIAAEARIPQWHQLAIQNIAQHARYPLFIASTSSTRLDDMAEECVHAGPNDLARLGAAVAHAIDASAPAVAGLDAEASELAGRIASALLAGKRPLIVAGASLGSKALIEAAANIASALKKQGKEGGISLVAAEANSLGVTLLGGKPVDAALAALTSGAADAVVVLENDLYRRAPQAAVDAALSAAKAVIVADHQLTATAERADLLLSAASFAEGDGTLINNEGRAQRFFQVFDPTYYDASNLVREGWRWLRAIQSTLQGSELDWDNMDQVTAACAAATPLLAGIADAAPKTAFRIRGMKLARAPHRYSGRTSMRANISVHEPRQPQDQDSPFAFSMEGYAGSALDRQQVPFAWSPGWNSPQAWNKFQDEVGGHLRAGDPGVRLFDAPSDKLGWFAAPALQLRAAGRWQVVAQYSLFGSDETSARAAVMESRIQPATISLGTEDASTLGLAEGALVSLTVAGSELRLPLSIDPQLASGLVGLPAGHAGIPPLAGELYAEALKEVKQ